MTSYVDCNHTMVELFEKHEGMGYYKCPNCFVIFEIKDGDMKEFYESKITKQKKGEEE